MSIDLTQFHAAFYEESFEAVATMEQTLLSLDAARPDADSINTIFRVAHSIKGGAATFGFGQITSFTHSLENLLDQLRSQRLVVTLELTQLLLRSVDVLRELLRAQQHSRPMDAQRVADLQFDLELAVARAGTAPAASGTPSTTAAASRLYRIDLHPFTHMLARGNDPLRMFRELRALGDLTVRADVTRLPPLESLDAEDCHLAWTLQLLTGAPREAILEVFDWAEADCRLAVELVDAAPDAGQVSAGAAAPSSGAPFERESSVSQGTGSLNPGSLNPGSVAPGSVHALDSSSIRVGVDKIDELMNSVGELVITRSMLGQLGGLLEGAGGERLRAGLAQLERNVRDLQESVMRVRMVPISFVFSRFPRMVHDLAQRLGKQIELQMLGADTELDKMVLEKIGDPLVHLVRNSIDHGIETAERRLAVGKSGHGTLQLHAYHRGSSITVEVSDDGAGLDAARILAKARERGLIDGQQPLDEQQIHELIFLPGFSTMDQATDVSGRGVGLDVVKRNVESLGGSVEVRSTQGRGARFVITLPLTLAIIDGQTVAVGEECYIVPLTAIVESLQTANVRIEQVVGHGEVLAFRGEYLPVVRLDRVFGDQRTRCRDTGAGLIMVVEGEGRRVGLPVDELLGQQQVVVKTLATNYGHVEGIAGATILGNGAVALILDVADLTRRVGQSRAA